MYAAVLKFRIFPCSFFTWVWPLYMFFSVNYRITRKEAWTLRVFLLGLFFPGSPIILETFFPYAFLYLYLRFCSADYVCWFCTCMLSSDRFDLPLAFKLSIPEWCSHAKILVVLFKDIYDIVVTDSLGSVLEVHFGYPYLCIRIFFFSIE